jgi:hypothetical protein
MIWDHVGVRALQKERELKRFHCKKNKWRAITTSPHLTNLQDRWKDVPSVFLARTG